MSLLTIIQGACDEIGIQRPSSVVNNSSQQIRQLLAIANKEGKTLARRHHWQNLIKEATHTTVAAEAQGDISTIAPGIDWQLTETFWNRTKQVVVPGPLTPQSWQRRKSYLVNGIYSEFRIRQNTLYMIPAPPAGETVAFEYVSKNWCRGTGLSETERSAWEMDSDIGLLDEELMRLGVIYRWKRAKGFSYGEEMRDYEIQVALAIANDGGGGQRINLACDDTYDRNPGGIIVPQGDWSL